MKRLSAHDYAQALTGAYAAVKPAERAGVVENFLQMLRRQRASNLLPRIISNLQQLSDIEQKQTRVFITSAQNIHETEIGALLHKALGNVVLETSVDPSLIAGLNIRVRDELVEGSVRGRLQRLHTHLTSSHV